AADGHDDRLLHLVRRDRPDDAAASAAISGVRGLRLRFFGGHGYFASFSSCFSSDFLTALFGCLPTASLPALRPERIVAIRATSRRLFRICITFSSWFVNRFSFRRKSSSFARASDARSSSSERSLISTIFCGMTRAPSPG